MKISQKLKTAISNDLYLLDDETDSARELLEKENYQKLSELAHNHLSDAIANESKEHWDGIIESIKFITLERLSCNCDLAFLFSNPDIDINKLTALQYKFDKDE
jgi:hypothetical protein